jgi:hypothetical protein
LQSECRVRCVCDHGKVRTPTFLQSTGASDSVWRLSSRGQE